MLSSCTEKVCTAIIFFIFFYFYLSTCIAH
jgi:hypothetical protein